MEYHDLPHNFTKEDIISYENVFSEPEVESIFQYLSRPNWRYGHVSSGQNYKNCPPFWSMSLVDDEFFTVHLLNKIKELTGEDLIISSVYANGQTYGLGGQPHLDANDDKGRTFIYYANHGWDVRWNGKTTFMFKNGYHHEMPSQNKAIYFPGIIKHFAEETSRTFGGLRMSVVWKLQLI